MMKTVLAQHEKLIARVVTLPESIEHSVLTQRSALAVLVALIAAQLSVKYTALKTITMWTNASTEMTINTCSMTAVQA